MPLDSNNNYTPPSASGYFQGGDLYNLQARQSATQPNMLPSKFEAKVVDTLPDGQIIHWRVILEDTRGGLNAVQGNFKELYDRVRLSTNDTRFYKTLILPQLSTTQTSPDPTGTMVGIHAVNIFNRLMIGVGSGNGSSLFKETSLSDPTIVATSYNASTSITGMYPAVIGGATSAQRLAICRSADPIQIISDANGTVAGTMHTDTDNSWAVQQTFAGEDDNLLIYANGAIRILSKTAAITDQPTVGLANVPNGGGSLGMIKYAGAPVRPTWIWPYENNASGMFQFGSETPGHVVQTNSDGKDYFEIPHGIPYVFWACNVNGTGSVASDRNRIMFYDGTSQARDLQWVSEREPDSRFIYQAISGQVNGNELYVEVNKINSTNSTSVTQRFWEVYNFETNAWHQVSESETLSSTGRFGLTASNGLPLSSGTGFLHQYSDGAWRRIFVPVYGYNPYTLYRNTVGSGNTGNEYAASGTTRWPDFELPGLEGWPKITTRIFFLGNVDAGGTGAYVDITAGNLTARFATGLEGRDQLAVLADNQDLWYKLQVSETMYRNPNATRYTPNGLPLMIEGYAFVGNNIQITGWQSDVR